MRFVFQHTSLWLRITFVLFLWGAELFAQDAGAPADAGAYSADDTPADTQLSLARLRVTVRAEPPGPSTAGILIESDDGQSATTGADGSADIELGRGPRALRFTLPPALTPAHAGDRPKLIRLDGIDLGETAEAELKFSISPDGTPASIELVAVAPLEEAPPVVPVTPARDDTERGQIVGTVTAKGDRARVEGVSVFVEGMDAQTTSDAAGRFSLSVPAGRHTVWIIHQDFPSLTLTDVEVRAGRETPIDVELEAPTAQTDDWVIRAQYIAGGVASILEERRKASTVSDALGSEEISKSPDSSASSATRRIVGASIVGGQYLFARGLGGRYTNVRLNGVPLPSTDPDLPGFQLDLFPASLLSSLVITKTFSPDMPGDFAGGSLNVVTRAFPERFKLSLSASLSYNTETTGKSLPRYDGGDLDWLGIDDGSRALPEEVPEERVWTGSGLGIERLTEISRSFPNVLDIDRPKAFPNLSLGASVGDTLTGKAGRFGYLFTLGYRHRFEHYDETVSKIGLAAAGAPEPVISLQQLNREIGTREAQIGALGSISYEPASEQRLSAVSLLTQTGEDRTSLTTGRSESEGTNIEQRQLRFIERRLLFNQLRGEHQAFDDVLELDWQLNYSRTLRDQPGTRDLLYTEGPNGWEFRMASGSGERLYTELRQSDLGGGVDLKLSLAKALAISAGYLGRSGERDFQARRFGIRLQGGPEDLRLAPEELFAPERAPTSWLINELTQQEDGYTAEESLHAAYAMLNTHPLSSLEIMGGLRMERFHQQIDVASPFAQPGLAPREGADRTDLDYLPAAALILAPREDMNIRASYGGTVARPLVRELAPFLNQDFVRRRYSQGNPALRRTFIHNFDMRWEMFPTPTEVFAVSGFYKIFQSPIETVILDQNGNLSFENIEGATNYGAELEARVGLGMLTPALEGFSALANLALIRSRVRLSDEQRGLATNGERPLAGQSPYVANLALGYDSGETGLSAYVYYNVFGRRIQEAGRLGLPDVYEEPFHSLDLTAFWRTESQLTLGLSASNVLLRPVVQTQGGLDFSRSERGANIGLSLSWAP